MGFREVIDLNLGGVDSPSGSSAGNHGDLELAAGV